MFWAECAVLPSQCIPSQIKELLYKKSAKLNKLNRLHVSIIDFKEGLQCWDEDTDVIPTARKSQAFKRCKKKKATKKRHSPKLNLLKRSKLILKFST